MSEPNPQAAAAPLTTDSLTDFEMEGFAALANKLVAQDGDFGRIFTTAVTARQLYRLAMIALVRYAKQESFLHVPLDREGHPGERFAAWAPECIQFSANRDVNLEEMPDTIKNWVLPFIQDELGREKSQLRFEALQTKANPLELMFKWDHKPQTLGVNQLLLVLGSGMVVDRALQQLLMTDTPGLTNIWRAKDGAAIQVESGEVVVFDHRHDGFDRELYHVYELDRWQLSARAPQRWENMLATIRRERTELQKLLVIRNLHHTYSESAVGDHRQFTRILGKTLRIMDKAFEELGGFSTVAGVYLPSADQKRLRAEVAKLAEKYQHVSLCEVS